MVTVQVLYFRIAIFCHFILPLHYIYLITLFTVWTQIIKY